MMTVYTIYFCSLFLHFTFLHLLLLQYIFCAIFAVGTAKILSSNDLDVLLSCNVNLKDLLLMFEPCKKEMKILLRYSLQRFKSDTEFVDDV